MTKNFAEIYQVHGGKLYRRSIGSSGQLFQFRGKHPSVDNLNLRIRVNTSFDMTEMLLAINRLTKTLSETNLLTDDVSDHTVIPESRDGVAIIYTNQMTGSSVCFYGPNRPINEGIPDVSIMCSEYLTPRYWDPVIDVMKDVYGASMSSPYKTMPLIA